MFNKITSQDVLKLLELDENKLLEELRKLNSTVD